MLKSQAPLPWNVTLFEDMVFEDKISEDKVILKYSGPLLLIEEEKRLGHARRQPCDDRGRDGVGAAYRTEPEEAPRTSELITAATTIFPLLLASVCDFCSPGLLQQT